MPIATARDGVVRTQRMPKGLRNPLYWGVGERLRALGISHRLTQTRIGEVSGVDQQMISRIEHGQNAPRIDMVERLATGLGISAAWLAFCDHGARRWSQRFERSPVPLDLPVPTLEQRAPLGLYKGMGDRLKQARAAAGLTLRAISPLIEEKWSYLKQEKKTISRQTILLLEAGRTVPLVKTCEAIALALNVSPGWLAYGEGEGPDGSRNVQHAEPDDRSAHVASAFPPIATLVACLTKDTTNPPTRPTTRRTHNTYRR